jgi:hypothetical protein
MRRRLVPRASDGDQPRRRVEQPHVVPLLGEPEGVGSGGAADVEHDRRRSRRMSEDQLAGAELLEAERAELEAGFLGRPVVVGLDVGIEVGRRWLGHGRAHSHREIRQPSKHAALEGANLLSGVGYGQRRTAEIAPRNVPCGATPP